MPADPLLRDLTVYDTEGTRWAVVQRWLKDIVETIDAGGGGGGGGLAGHDIATMTVVGTAVLNSTYGYFKANAPTVISRVQIACQTAPVGSALTLTLVDASGTSLGATASVAGGAEYQETVINPPLSLATGDTLRLKVTAVGSGTNGGYLTVNLISPNSSGRDIATMTIVGSVVLNSTYGYFQTSTNTTVSRAQIACQTAPVGSALTITFVDGSGTSLGVTATVAAGADYQETLFGSPVTFPAGTIIRAKVTAVGSTTPGGYLVINLL